MKSGKVRALALFATERSPLFAELPTAADLVIPECDGDRYALWAGKYAG